MIPGKMKGKFWGITAAPIQSTGDPERRWQLLSYFRGIKGVNTIKAQKFALKWSEVTMSVRIGKEVVLKEESVWNGESQSEYRKRMLTWIPK